MGETVGRPVVLYDTTASGFAAIATGNNNLISSTIDLRFCGMFSVQILTDGGAIVNYALQVTNLPASSGEFGRKILGATARDDTYTSPQWSTVSSGQLLATGQKGTIVTFSTNVHNRGRLTFNWDAANGGGTTAHILAVALASGTS